MNTSVVYVDRSLVRPGKLAELKEAIAELSSDFEANEPELIAYLVFLDDTETQMTVMHVHRDVASLELHMKIGGPRFPRFAPLVELKSIDVYGAVNDEVMARLRDKAQTLGGATVEAHKSCTGFLRTPA